MDAEVAVVGAGVVGCAAALALARRGVSVALLEAEPEPGLQASGTNSGILHTGFDSIPGELETELILRAAAAARPGARGARRAGAALRGADAAAARRGARRDRRPGRERRAQRRSRRSSATTASLEVPGESVTDPVAFTLALAGAAEAPRRRASHRLSGRGRSSAAATASPSCRRERRRRRRPARRQLRRARRRRAWRGSAGDDSFDVYPRKGEFLVFDPPAGAPLERILLPVPSERTKGVLVFPTLDGKVVAGPTAVDQEDPDDWSVRPQRRRRDPAQGAADVPAARRRRAGRRIRRAAARRSRRQLPDRRRRSAARAWSTWPRSAPPA